MLIKYQRKLDEIKNYFKENKSLGSLLKPMIKDFVKYLIETILETKIEYERSKAAIKKNWYRNGYYQRHLLTTFGLIENIKVPRLRNMVYENGIFQKWQRRLEDVDRFIIKIFTQGESYRDIKRIVRDFLDELTISLSTISRIKNKAPKSFISKYSEIEPEAVTVAIFLDDGLIKAKYSIELSFNSFMNTKNLNERFIREIRRRAKIIE